MSTSSGFSKDNMRPWRIHWDRQLYKGLEHQYQMGLESLNNNLTEIKIEVIRLDIWGNSILKLSCWSQHKIIIKEKELFIIANFSLSHFL